MEESFVLILPPPPRALREIKSLLSFLGPSDAHFVHLGKQQRWEKQAWYKTTISSQPKYGSPGRSQLPTIPPSQLGPVARGGRELGGQGGTATWKALMGTSWPGWGPGTVGYREGGARRAGGHSGRATDSSELGVAAGGPHLPDCCSPDASTAGQAHPTR